MRPDLQLVLLGLIFWASNRTVINVVGQDNPQLLRANENIT